MRYSFSLIRHRFKKREIYSVVDFKSYKKYESELLESKLFEHIKDKEIEFWKKVNGKNFRGVSYVFGSISNKEAVVLYALVRHLKPKILVETGVCNGVSTAVILQALHENNEGFLHSIDFPEKQGIENTSHWKGKGGATVPVGKDPGWIIPHDLKNKWELLTGKSQDLLIPLLESLGQIDFFVHDSEHSKECMHFEIVEAYRYLSNNGTIIVDDYYWNGVFRKFSKNVGDKLYYPSEGMAFLVKTKKKSNVHNF